jgi:hypothetical protein
MIDGVELFQLRQRRSATGDTYFTGKLGSAAVVVIRDDVERDVWRVIAGDPFRANTRSTSAARAIAAPKDDGDRDEGDDDEGNATTDDAFDELPPDLTPSSSHGEAR